MDVTGTADDRPRSYYGRPVIKEPVWRWPIPAYLFTGGLAGASASLAVVARLAGQDRLARGALVGALAGAVASPPLLIEDLGRPERFLNMMRVAKPTSPMSVGTWLISAFVPAVCGAAVSELTGVAPRAGRGLEVVAGVLGPAMATYTAVLVADTAVPVWHEARRELPFLFAGSAAASAGAAAMVLTPPRDARAARRLLVLGALLEVGTSRVMARGHLDVTGPYTGDGPAARLGRLAKALTIIGATITLGLARRRRSAALVGGGLTLAGALVQRVSVFRAGFESARDPHATTGPQRRRVVAAEG